MVEIIDIEKYHPTKKHRIDANIDIILMKHSLFRLQKFAYTAGDCLFNAFEVLLHFRYSSIELRNGIINHFLNCLQRNDTKAKVSYQYELDPVILYQLHGIHDVDTYLHKMRFSASNRNFQSERGLSGDTFFIRWLSKWLNIPIGVWSLTMKTRYLFFNHDLDKIPLNILFHDTNPISGHFEPLLYKILRRCDFVPNYSL